MHAAEPELAEQLSAVQQALRDKTKSMKSVASELNMCQAQLGERKYEMERASRELQDVKRKYYEYKRKETLLWEKERQQAERDRAAAVHPGRRAGEDGHAAPGAPRC